VASSVRIRCLSTGLLCLLVALPAYAGEPSAQERETARRLMDEGDAKTSEKDYAHATEAYEKAHAIMHVPSTGLELARSYERQGRLIEARDVSLEVLRIPKLLREPEAFQRARLDATKLSESVATRIGTLTFEITGLAPGVVPRVSVDGNLVPDAARSAGLAADPGKHLVEASSSGYLSAKVEVVLQEAGRVPVSLHLEQTEAPAQVQHATSPPANAQSERSTPLAEPVAAGVSPLTIGLLSVGGAGLVLGGITGAISLSKTSALSDACPNKRCPADQANALSGARTLAWVSNVSFGVSVLGAGVGTALLVSELSSPAKTSRGPKPLLSVTSQGAWMGLGGGF
jgi:hypothetical protein